MIKHEHSYEDIRRLAKEPWLKGETAIGHTMRVYGGLLPDGTRTYDWETYEAAWDDLVALTELAFGVCCMVDDRYYGCHGFGPYYMTININARNEFKMPIDALMIFFGNEI